MSEAGISEAGIGEAGIAETGAGGQKSSAAFRTISEVAGELGLPQHVLRFWESKFPQIKPLKRGGGRRYYRPEDVDLLRGIRHLLYEDGYTIKGVRKVLRETSARQVSEIGRRLAKGLAPVLAAPAESAAKPLETASVLAAKQRQALTQARDDLKTLKAEIDATLE